MIQSIPCDIVLLAAPQLAQEAIILSQQLQDKHQTLFVLGEHVCVPHVSVYMTQLRADRFGEAKELLAAIARRTDSLQLVSTAYTQAEGYIDIAYQHTTQIDDLQMAVVNALNPIRDGMRQKDRGRMLVASGKARENYEKYGYPKIAELFQPHLTFARFSDGQAIKADLLPGANTFNGQYIGIGLFEMGDNGTCIRKIAEFPLNGAA